MKFAPLALLVILLVSLVGAVSANSNNPSDADAANNGGMRIKRQQQQWRWSPQQQRWVPTNIANVNIAQNG
ncbi:hypothetical protein niasHT_010702 [Heterodera trifolii]|uniref:Uncharacterized protein n=1 Tax=Heterodera trifolii TaxID=157864 RepID=A0ABD2JA19_9BILA